MSTGMDFKTAINGLMMITPKLARIMVWIVFAVIHLVFVVVALTLFWVFQISPSSIQAWVVSLLPVWLVSTTTGIIAFVGLSGLAILLAYAKAWRWLLHKLLSAFLFSK